MCATVTASPTLAKVNPLKASGFFLNQIFFQPVWTRTEVSADQREEEGARTRPTANEGGWKEQTGGLRLEAESYPS